MLNSGGTSIKYQLFGFRGGELVTVAKGAVESIGQPHSLLKFDVPKQAPLRKEIEAKDHAGGLEQALRLLVDPEIGPLSSYSEIDAVGHRVVQAGEKFRGTFLIDDALLMALREHSELAPLHNPPNIRGIEACRRLMPGVPQVAVFDNAFHKDLPDYAYIYALPYEYYEKYGVRRYGFHGISFKYMTERAAELLKVDVSQKRIISLMLGSGTTINALAYGHSVDVSTGLSPTEGLVQSTRCGDLDPFIITHIMRKEGLSLEEMDEVLSKRSGWLGISGVSNDLRLVEEAAEEGNPQAKLALRAFTYRAKKYIGAYAAAMGGLDLVLFAGGVGENSSVVRAEICRGLEFLGIELDEERNAQLKGEGLVSRPEGSVPVLVVDTNEEAVIAQETYALVTVKSMLELKCVDQSSRVLNLESGG
ncbi:acetate/propionate family kinase [Acididesulfobacillus acetoxydans]|uniref:acetate/propionate family kinase n=1 Tax=Acididesulfobacillus acetoxydans TaxID=1561005 RepID=UPI001F0D0644|nr:acetate kinase [Acididesulfobacillus acetoxydans]